MTVKKIGLALGGGGAKGVSHLLILETLEELGLRPAYVTGTSIGALIGAMYCAGMPTQDIKDIFLEFSLKDNESIKHLVTKKHIFKWMDFIGPQFRGKGLIRVENLITYLFESVQANRFTQLEIPLKVVASDFWNRQQVVLDKGALIPAIRASMSLPGLFEPVKVGGRILIDGGAVNPVPFDLLPDSCDLRIAVDVIGERSDTEKMPSLSEAVFNTYQIMQKSIIREKLDKAPPEIYIEPNVVNVKMLEFYRANEIFKQGTATKSNLKRKITLWEKHHG
ncbi:MAG: patatin-like phospholipase family protein [Gammaproteobacteria bacterium]|nr:MAG: patatin-like phospholipase family protein [Gammaproteobacteria bacterium]